MHDFWCHLPLWLRSAIYATGMFAIIISGVLASFGLLAAWVKLGQPIRNQFWVLVRRFRRFWFVDAWARLVHEPMSGRSIAIMFGLVFFGLWFYTARDYWQSATASECAAPSSLTRVP